MPEVVMNQPPSFKAYQAQPDEEYMSSEQCEHFRQILMNWRDELMHGAEDTIKNLRHDKENCADEVDSATRDELHNLEMRTRDRERKLLHKIGLALDFLRKGQYGYCEDCGNEIGIRRLEVRPTATKCIDCKTISEIKEKQLGLL